jgi:predicted DNA-binding protein (MmcQ/YjbR family)
VKVDDVIRYSLGKPGAQEAYPFGEGSLVCKVGGKSFAFIGLESRTVGVKCGPTAEGARELRDKYPDDVTVAAYVGRFGWNTVPLNGPVPTRELRDLVDQSYDTIVSKLPKSRRPS